MPLNKETNFTNFLKKKKVYTKTFFLTMTFGESKNKQHKSNIPLFHITFNYIHIYDIKYRNLHMNG